MPTSPRDQLLFDIFTTALEGGIGYWSQASAYHWQSTDDAGSYNGDDVQGFYAVVREYDEDTDLRIDRAVVAKGYTLATSGTWLGRIAWSSSEKPPLVITTDTDWDFDAGDADVIVQLGLFGEVVYG